MKTKPWRTTQFKELERAWYEILKTKGFIDIEKNFNGKAVLKQRATNCYRGASELAIESKRRYFEVLEQMLHEEWEVLTEVERIVIVRKSEGLKLKQIAEEIKKTTQTVKRILWKHEKRWGIKRYINKKGRWPTPTK